MPAVLLYFLGGGIKDVQDIRGLAIADLDAKGIHQDEPVNTMAARDRDFRRQPAAKGQSHEADPLMGQRFKDV